MATQEQIQEIANRGLQDQLPPDKRAKFDELVTRGVISLPDQPGFVDKVAGVGEAALSIGSSIVAEPVAGLAALTAADQRVGEFQSKGANLRPATLDESVQKIDDTREALTFQPRTQEGQDNVQAVAETLEPVAEVIQSAEEDLGNSVFEATNSPALAAAATAIPTLAAELVGFGIGRAATKTKRVAKNVGLTKEINEGTPTSIELRQVSRQIYKEIDDAGIQVDPNSFSALSKKITDDVTKAGLDPNVTPSSAAALKRINDAATNGKPLSVSEVDTLRKIAQNAAKNINNPADAALGVRMIDSIDEFLDNATPGKDLIGSPEAVTGVGAKYKAARELWGRSKKSESLQDAIEIAKDSASGFENGLRVEFRKILKNKKQRKFYTADELNAMREVVRGDKKTNFAKVLGRLGSNEGGATNVLGAGVGVGVGATVGATIAGAPGAVVGAVTVVGIGNTSRKLAQRLTKGKAKFADDVVRAGRDGRKIAEAYIRNTPKAQRSAAELSELLIAKGSKADNLLDTEFMRAAKQATNERIAELSAAATAGAGVAASEQQN